GRIHPLQGRRAHEHRRSVPRRRCSGPDLPPGHHGLGRRLYGGDRSRTLSGIGRTLTMIEYIFSPDSPAPRAPYSPAVRAGDFIFVSGQAVVGTDVKAETRQVLT